MQDKRLDKENKLDMLSVFKLEKRLQVFVAVCLSIILLIITLILALIPMSNDLQQVFIIILGLITIATLDAFRQALSHTSSSLAKEFRQIIVHNGGMYIDGNVEEIDKATNIKTGYYIKDGYVVNNESEQKSLAEAAAEIQDLLKQLEEKNPNASEAEKVEYINAEIEPNMKSRLSGAIKAGNKAAIDNLLDSPYINVVKAVIEGWIETSEDNESNID